MKKLIETNIDDSPPEIFSFVMDKLFEAGALDVWLTSIIMKKNRLATKLSVLMPDGKVDDAVTIIMRETSSIGLRISEVQRVEADRKIVEIKTDYGQARVKLAYYKDKLVNISPEFEDCKKIANKKRIPLKNVCDEVLRVATEKYTKVARNYTTGG